MAEWSIRNKSYSEKRLSDMTEEEFIDFYLSTPDHLKPFLLMTDCKQLTYAIDKIQDKLPQNKIKWYQFWKLDKKCPYCDNEMMYGRTLHCGKGECSLKHTSKKNGDMK